MLLTRPLAVLLGVTIVLVGIKIESVGAGFETAVPQGMNPQQVAAAIKANAQALKAFSYQKTKTHETDSR